MFSQCGNYDPSYYGRIGSALSRGLRLLASIEFTCGQKMAGMIMDISSTWLESMLMRLLGLFIFVLFILFIYNWNHVKLIKKCNAYSHSFVLFSFKLRYIPLRPKMHRRIFHFRKNPT